MNIDFKRKLPIPKELKEKYPIDQRAEDIVNNIIKEEQRILSGEDDKRLMLIIGPCSTDNEDALIEYVSRLNKVRNEVKNKLLIVPRIYTGKPRTTGKGYKGLLHQPDPQKAPDLFLGITETRRIHSRVVNEYGFAGADEMLYPESVKYIDDVVGYIAVGARSVEDQQHRLLASGLSCPVGMKNPTSGDLSVMVNAICAAQNEHDFIYRGWEGHSYGNQYAHGILRGYVDYNGITYPNYHYENLIRLENLYRKANIVNPAVIIDCNHANSGKNPFEQPRIIREVMQSRKYNPCIRNIVKGFMVESYIEDGKQDVDGNVFGKSITDPCLGWKNTKDTIYKLAELF